MSAMPELDPEALATLRERVQGRVLAPGDADWGAASMAWSLVPQAPVAVVEAEDVDDVVATVLWAGEHAVAVAAQPGGHGATGSASGAVLLRTGRLDGFTVEADQRLARVGAGVKWGRFLPALEEPGLLALAGSNPDVTVVGYLLGGGLSWFARLRGYAVHTWRAAEIVDAEGRLRWVSDENDPELMWALRGGGGDVAIVTQVEIELLPAPELYGGKLMFGLADAVPVLEAFVAVTHGAPPELTLWASVLHFPDVDVVPEPMRGQSFVTIDATYVGPGAEGEAHLAPIRAAGTLIGDTTGTFPIGRLGEVSAEPTDPTPSIDWAAFLTDVTAETVARFAAAVADPTRTALAIAQIRHVGAGLADPPSPSPAAADRVSAQYIAGAIGIPVVPELVGPIRSSIEAFVAALAPELSTDRLPLNFVAVGEPVSRAFDEDTLERLRALKRSVDPAGTIRGNFPLVAPA